MKKIKLEKSKKFWLNFFDILKSCIVAGITGALTLAYQQIENGEIDLDIVIKTALLGAIGYLVKNVFEGETNKKLKTEEIDTQMELDFQE